MSELKAQKRARRQKRIRAKISGTAERPRLSIFRSNKDITAQLIDDTSGNTLVYVWTKTESGKTLKERAVSAGTKIAELAKAKKISKVVFDRGGYLFAGNIKTFADSAKAGGLEF